MLTAAVWMGYPGTDGQPVTSMVNLHGVEKVGGGTFPAQIWARFMTEATKDTAACTLPTSTRFPGERVDVQGVEEVKGTIPAGAFRTTTTAPPSTTTSAAPSTTTTAAPAGSTTTTTTGSGSGSGAGSGDGDGNGDVTTTSTEVTATSLAPTGTTSVPPTSAPSPPSLRPHTSPGDCSPLARLVPPLELGYLARPRRDELRAGHLRALGTGLSL